jgi:CheY-like chemotaxis protein
MNNKTSDTDRLQSEFLSNLGHELRTPLNSILALSRLMLSRGVGKNPSKDTANLEVIERNGCLLLDLVNDILNRARIEPGHIELFPGDFKSAQPVENTLDAIKPAAGNGLPNPGQCILVVEDNRDNLFIITSLLDDAGHRYITANNGLEAVSQAKTHQPALILMDIQLPVLNGLEAAGQIKADPALAAVPIIALTASTMPGDKETILSGGCEDYIAKPIDAGQFLQIIDKWLKQRGS